MSISSPEENLEDRSRGRSVLLTTVARLVQQVRSHMFPSYGNTFENQVYKGLNVHKHFTPVCLVSSDPFEFESWIICRFMQPDKGKG